MKFLKSFILYFQELINIGKDKRETGRPNLIATITPDSKFHELMDKYKFSNPKKLLEASLNVFSFLLEEISKNSRVIIERENGQSVELDLTKFKEDRKDRFIQVHRN